MPRQQKAAQTVEPPAPEVKEKKKRTANPGVRVQGGRIYDSASGTTCHQCRQKTVEVKAKCTKCTLFWCPRCLSNRYGEVVEEVATLEEWRCPRCRDQCNCSNCRKKRGLEATGILANVCKAAGIGSVSELLHKNPTAKRPALPPAQPKPKGPKVPKENKPLTAKETSSNRIRDEELGARPAPFPEGSEVHIFRGKAASRRKRGGAWPAGLGDSLAVPSDCSVGDLLEVTEFLQVFGADIGCRVEDVAFFAGELIQPQGVLFCEDHRSSAVGKVHQCLLDLVRRDWGLKGTVGVSGWQDVMRQYLKQDLEEAAEKLGLALKRDEPAVCFGTAEDDSDLGLKPEMRDGCDESEKSALPEFPAGGYWSLPPGVRLRMLRALCHDALGTATIRDRMEKAFEEAAAAAKQQRETAAAARKEVQLVWQKERDRQIALLITEGGGQSLTIEEQRAVMEAAKSKIEAAVQTEQGDAEVVAHAALRSIPLGTDREDKLFWKLQTAEVFTGKEGAVLVAKPWRAVEADEWQWHDDLAPLVRSLDPRGQKEGPLKERLQLEFSIDDLSAEEGSKSESSTGQENKQPVDGATVAAPAKKRAAGKTAKKRAV